jgi:hypothetical protein
MTIPRNEQPRPGARAKQESRRAVRDRFPTKKYRDCFGVGALHFSWSWYKDAFHRQPLNCILEISLYPRHDVIGRFDIRDLSQILMKGIELLLAELSNTGQKN